MLAVIILLVFTNIITIGLMLKQHFPRSADVLKSRDPAVRTAAHEAGHALVALQSPAVSYVSEVSIIADHSIGMAGVTHIAYNQSSPLYLWERLIVLMGGAAGEMFYCGTMRSGGCKKDLLEALDLARKVCSQTKITVTNSNFPFDITQCYSGNIIASERQVLNMAYAEARKRIHNKPEHLKAITIDLLRSGRLSGNNLPRI